MLNSIGIHVHKAVLHVKQYWHPCAQGYYTCETVSVSKYTGHLYMLNNIGILVHRAVSHVKQYWYPSATGSFHYKRLLKKLHKALDNCKHP